MWGLVTGRQAFWRGFRQGLDPRYWPSIVRRWFGPRRVYVVAVYGPYKADLLGVLGVFTHPLHAVCALEDVGFEPQDIQGGLYRREEDGSEARIVECEVEL